MTNTAARRAAGTGTLVLAMLASVALVDLYAPPANAYVRYLAKNGSPYVWAPSCVRIIGYPQGVLNMTVDQITIAVTQAAAAWSKQNPMQGGCSYLDLPVTMQPETQAPPDAKYDHYNNVVFRGTEWSTLCSPASDGTLVCHDPGALAITSVFARSTGEIVDADVEVNAVNFRWGDLVTNPPTGPSRDQDLQNALTHEFGHLIGLDHTCYIYASGGADDPAHPRPKDQNGDLIPDCSNASADVEATTMFASADPGDVSKRSLEPDDLQAVCEIYPLSADPLSCTPAYDDQGLCDAKPRAMTTTSCPTANQNGGGGCSVAAQISAAPLAQGAEPPFPSFPPWAVATVIVGLGMVMGTRRRRRP